MGDTEVLTRTEESSDLGDSSYVETRQGSGCCFYFCDPRSSIHRFIVLLFMCFVGFGSYYCYDNPGALQDYFIQDMGITTTQYTLVYAWYSWPNVVLCFVGGYLLDSVFGIRLGTVIFCFFLLIGQAVFALGGFLDMFWLMIVGRFIFGIGGESLAVAQNTYAVSWFKGKELNMVFGLQLSFARVGSTVNFHVMEPVYKWVNQYYQGHTCLGIVLFIAGVTCILSLVCAIALAIFDYRAEKILKKQNAGTGEKVHLSDVLYFPVTFWFMCGSCVAYYVAIFPFIGLGKVFFERKFDYAPELANSVNSILYIVSAVASPLFGLLVDRTGRNVLYVFLSILATIGAHALLAFTFLNPYIGMCLMGLGYSMLASALWPMVALVVPEHQLGTAYGLMQAVQNLGLAVISIIAGAIVDKGGYLLLEVFLIAWLCLSLACTVIMWLYDSSHTGLLNMSVEERDRWEHDKMLAEALERDESNPSDSHVPSSSIAITARCDFQVRNRYLSRIGAPLPPSYDPVSRRLLHRPLR